MKIGTTLPVLVQQQSKKNGDEYLAKSEFNDMIIVPAKENMIGTFTSVRITGMKGSTLKGELLWSPGN